MHKFFTPPPPDPRRMFQVVYGYSPYLLRDTISMLLELSRAQKAEGKITYFNTVFDQDEIIAQAHSRLRRAGKSRNVNIIDSDYLDPYHTMDMIEYNITLHKPSTVVIGGMDFIGLTSLHRKMVVARLKQIRKRHKIRIILMMGNSPSSGSRIQGANLQLVQMSTIFSLDDIIREYRDRNADRKRKSAERKASAATSPKEPTTPPTEEPEIIGHPIEPTENQSPPLSPANRPPLLLLPFRSTYQPNELTEHAQDTSTETPDSETKRREFADENKELSTPK